MKFKDILKLMKNIFTLLMENKDKIGVALMYLTLFLSFIFEMTPSEKDDKWLESVKQTIKDKLGIDIDGIGEK